MSPLDVLAHPACARLTLTLLHFLWQGALVAVLLAAVISLFRVRRAHVRYLLSLTALVIAAACPFVTFVALGNVTTEVASHAPFASAFDADYEFRAKTSVDHELTSDSVVLPVATSSLVNYPDEKVGTANVSAHLNELVLATQPFVLIVWCCGVLLLSARMLFGLAGINWLRRGRLPLNDELAQRAAAIGRRLGVSGVRVFVSHKVKQALVMGFWRPFVLLPASWLAEMSPETLEAIIAHELAHIRRWDLWVNLFQRIVETLLFYHPAVWWLSHRIRFEREMCCDELAVAATGRRVVYAHALEQVASRKLAGVRPALAAAINGESKMKLLKRVRNVLGLSPAKDKARWWPVGLLLLVLPLGIWAATGFVLPAASNAVADDEGEREVQRDGDKEREEGDRDRRDGERPRDGERREGDRPRDGERPRGEGERRDGDQPRGEGERRESDRPRELDRPRTEGERRETDRPRGEGERGEGQLTPREAAMMRMIQELRQELAALRREVNELRGRRGEGERGEGERRISDRERPRGEGAERPDRPREGAERERGQPRREGERDEPRREGERERDGDREREGDERREREGDRERDEEGEERERDSDERERDGDGDGDGEREERDEESRERDEEREERSERDDDDERERDEEGERDED